MVKTAAGSGSRSSIQRRGHLALKRQRLLVSDEAGKRLADSIRLLFFFLPVRCRQLCVFPVVTCLFVPSAAILCAELLHPRLFPKTAGLGNVRCLRSLVIVFFEWFVRTLFWMTLACATVSSLLGLRLLPSVIRALQSHRKSSVVMDHYFLLSQCRQQLDRTVCSGEKSVIGFSDS